MSKTKNIDSYMIIAHDGKTYGPYETRLQAVKTAESLAENGDAYIYQRTDRVTVIKEVKIESYAR